MCQAVPMHAVKAWRGNRGKAPLILNHRTRWRWCLVIHSGWFIPAEKPLISTQHEAVLAQVLVWTFGKGKNLKPRAYRPITAWTTLSQFSLRTNKSLIGIIWKCIHMYIRFTLCRNYGEGDWNGWPALECKGRQIRRKNEFLKQKQIIFCAQHLLTYSNNDKEFQ